MVNSSGGPGFAGASKELSAGPDGYYLMNLTYFDITGSAGYNLRLTEYGNGTAQIRLYDQVMQLGSGTNHQKKVYFIEPFGGTKVSETDDFGPKTDLLELRNISLARTKRKIYEYSQSIRWDYFITLTFDPKKVDRSNYQLCCKRVCRWLWYIRQHHSPDLRYLIVPELCKDGSSFHFHGLIAHIGDLRLIDSGHLISGKTAFNIVNWHYGFSTALHLQKNNLYRISRYITKYMTKACHALSHGAHRYFISKNLPSPKNSIFFIEPGEEYQIICDIADRLNMRIVHSTKSEGNYTGMIYVDLEPIFENVN